MNRNAAAIDKVFSGTLLLSLVMHGILLVLLPGVRLLERVDVPEWLPVDLVAPIEPEIQPLPEKVAQNIDQGVDDGRIGESPVFPNPPVWLPDRMNPVDFESVPMRLTLPTDQLPDLAGPGITIPGNLMSNDQESGGTNPLTDPGRNPPDMAWKPSRAGNAVPEHDDEPDLQISGEVANRQVIYKPPVPRPTASMSGTILLKFWVQPDGTIGKILPITRGDPELEKIAMEYFEKFRFAAVSAETGNQSGTVPIRFRIR